MKEGKEELEEIKNNLTIDQIEKLVYDLGGEPYKEKDNILICKTICHCGEKHKLYYYSNTHLFRCFTECADTFDIFNLLEKIQKNNGNTEWNLSNSVNYIKKYFNIEDKEDKNVFKIQSEDWKILNRYKKEEEIKEKRKIDLKFYEKDILKHFPHPRILNWEKEGITREVMEEVRNMLRSS